MGKVERTCGILSDSSWIVAESIEAEETQNTET
jgi:hypothetical protein